MNWNIDKIGLPKMLTETPIGDALDLSEAQQDQIRKKSHELAKRLTKQIEEAQQEAMQIVHDVLDDSQAERLIDAYGDRVKPEHRIEAYKIIGDYFYPNLEKSETNKSSE